MQTDQECRRNAAIGIARRYLLLMEQRNLDEALPLVNPDAVFIFPGGKAHASLGDIVAGSARRYQFIGKTIEACDVGFEPDHMVVYVRGTLHGHWLDGRAFSGIRFIDRFEISDGLIRRQEVWNDVGEHRAGNV